MTISKVNRETLCSGIGVCMFMLLLPCTSQGYSGKTAGPLAPFEILVGGTWRSGDSSHVFSWGAGSKSIMSKSYFSTEAGAKLVSEAMWFFHPEDASIRGIVSAVDMPFELMEMNIRFAAGTLTSDLRAIAPDGTVTEARETWQFVSDDRYEWTLYDLSSGVEKKWMTGTYIREAN